MYLCLCMYPKKKEEKVVVEEEVRKNEIIVFVHTETAAK